MFVFGGFVVEGRLGGVVHVDPMKPTLKSPRTKRLKLKYKEPLSVLKAPGTKRLKLNYGEPLSKLAFKN
jgi:hypothetical protein